MICETFNTLQNAYFVVYGLKIWPQFQKPLTMPSSHLNHQVR